MANPSDSETSNIHNVVPVIYFTGTYGSALINFLNAHHGWMTTLPDIRLAKDGRAEGGIRLTKNDKLCFVDSSQEYPIPPHLRVAVRFHHNHQSPRMSELTVDPECPPVSQLWRKAIYIDILNSNYKNIVMSRSAQVLSTLTGMFDNADDCDLPMNDLRYLAEKKLDIHLEEAKAMDHLHDTSFRIHFDQIADRKRVHEWYGPMCEYLEIEEQLWEPERYWRYLQYQDNIDEN